MCVGHVFRLLIVKSIFALHTLELWVQRGAGVDFDLFARFNILLVNTIVFYCFVALVRILLVNIWLAHLGTSVSQGAGVGFDLQAGSVLSWVVTVISTQYVAQIIW